jgi:hypothetical protein
MYLPGHERTLGAAGGSRSLPKEPLDTRRVAVRFRARGRRRNKPWMNPITVIARYSVGSGTHGVYATVPCATRRQGTSAPSQPLPSPCPTLSPRAFLSFPRSDNFNLSTFNSRLPTAPNVHSHPNLQFALIPATVSRELKTQNARPARPSRTEATQPRPPCGPERPTPPMSCSGRRRPSGGGPPQARCRHARRTDNFRGPTPSPRSTSQR